MRIEIKRGAVASNAPRKLTAIIILTLLWFVATPAHAEMMMQWVVGPDGNYVYPGFGCTCYGPPFNLDECRGALVRGGLGIGITVQGFNPSTDLKCGLAGADYGDKLLGVVSVQDCCIRHDIDSETCEMPRHEGTGRLSSCLQSACGALSWNSVLWGLCSIAAGRKERQMTVGVNADELYKSTLEQKCQCSPCGMRDQNCYLELPPKSLGIYYPNDPRDEVSPYPKPGWFFIPFPGFGGGTKLEFEEGAVYAKALLDDEETRIMLLTCQVPFWPLEQDEPQVQAKL